MIFETHAHYDDAIFDHDREELLCTMEKQEIGAIVNAGSSLDSIVRIRELIQQYSFMYGAAGIHPCDTGTLTEEHFLWLKEQCKHEKIVAVGEIGLDYYWKETDPAIQKMWFERQLLMAQEVSLPVIIHSREAAKDTLDIMKSLHAEKTGGVIHCFSYSREMAREFLELNVSFGIGGVITFPNARKLKEAVDYIPMDRLLLETDSPYLSPVPYRGKRNSSLNLSFIIDRIAEIKGISSEKVIEITTDNAEKLFKVRCKG